MFSTIPNDEFLGFLGTELSVFEIISIPISTTPIVEKGDIRTEFDKKARHDFITYLAQRRKTQLSHLIPEDELDDYEIAKLKTNTSDIPAKLAKLGYNVDHIIPVKAGGDNNYSNLVLLPQYLHRLKNNFEKIANIISINPREGHLTTLAPKGYSTYNKTRIIIKPN